jgi:hypothetical protein
VKFETKDKETGLICLKGSATVRAGDQSITLGRFDSLYVPRETAIEVTAGSGGCDFAELAAPVDRAYPIQFVPYQTVVADPGLHLNVGGPTNKRPVDILIGKNVQAGDPRRRHGQRARQLDVVAAARTRGVARGGVSLHRHAGAVVRPATRLHRFEGTGTRHDRA